MDVNYIDGVLLKNLVTAGANNLQANKQIVDALNVFPVPDGDTGTNMFLSIQSAVKEAQKVDSNNVGKVAEAIAFGALMGARGNSGVILSQLFRGFAKSVENKERLNALDLAYAWQEGVKTAYKAVMRPVEGTILTVSREGAKAAFQAAKRGASIREVWEACLAAAELTLLKTPEMLPQLKQANVVDAGGKGYCFILQGGLRFLEGKGEQISVHEEAVVSEDADAVQAEIEEADIPFQYCTEFLLRGVNLPVEGIKKELAGYGDSLLVVGTPELLKIHVHSNSPGLVLDYCCRFGELDEININNMKIQNRRLAKTDEIEKEEQKNEVKETGIIAVAVGQGLIEVFKSLGVDYVVEGGQTVNPSTEELLTAVNSVNAKNVVILPNNSNIILAAEQVKEMTDKNVLVIPSKTFPQGMSAMLAYNPENSLPRNEEAMRSALENVKTGEVTYAVRDSIFDGVEIKQGDYIGLYNGRIQTSGRNKQDVALKLLEEMVDSDSELVTIFYGEEIEKDEVENLVDQIKIKYSDLETEVVYGGQPLYYYIFSVE
ncbi:MAG TPA: DAK2 domain-containing protein [Clostridia bacterium]|nr:DAK2 domain-containing protein [Clostridia bacterium]